MPAKNTWPQSRIDKLVALYKQEFDKLFSGPIPCGHWMITKKWELTDEQKESLDAED